MRLAYLPALPLQLLKARGDFTGTIHGIASEEGDISPILTRLALIFIIRQPNSADELVQRPRISFASASASTAA